MSKHMPGPWVAAVKDGKIVICASTERLGLMPIVDDVLLPEDATLIAAAPDMYEALRLVREDLAEAGEFADAQLVRAVCDAIAKAEGRD